MHADLQHQLVRRIQAHLAARTTDTSPAGPTRLPVDRYTDPARLAREQRALFQQLPVAVGHASQLARPGDFLTHDATGAPLLVVRQDDGSLAAFYNVCRHRGTRVEPAACGTKQAFVCPYHAWSYGRDGALLGVPHERAGFATLERRHLALAGPATLAATEVAGFVFVHPAGTDPRAYLGAFADELAGFGTARAHVYAPRTTTRALGWKLAIDVFLETYHLRTAHRDTIYRLFFDNIGLVDFQPGTPHIRTCFPKRTIRDLAAGAVELRHHANILYHLFPNTLALVQPDHVSVFHAWPRGPAETVIASYTLVPEPPATDKARRHWDANNAILYEAVDEDLALGESIQRGLACGANTHVQLGAFEHALAHFHAACDARAATIAP